MAITFKKESVLALIDAEIAKNPDEAVNTNSIEQQFIDEKMADYDRDILTRRDEIDQQVAFHASVLRGLLADTKGAVKLSDRDLLAKVVSSLRDEDAPGPLGASALLKVGPSEEGWKNSRRLYLETVERRAKEILRDQERRSRSSRRSDHFQSETTLYEAREVISLSTSEVFTMTDLKSLGVYRLILNQAPKPAKAIEAPADPSVDTPDADGVIDPEIVE